MSSCHCLHASRRIALLAIATNLFAACSLATETRPLATLAEKPPVSLAISGFNYTALPVDLFSVDSTGGGNLLVSTATSGGGGSTCCYKLFPSASLPYPVEVQWMRDFGRRKRWCRKAVMMDGPLPQDPTDLAVHFMPDGAIQIEVSHGYPKLLLALERFDPGHRNQAGNVIHDEEKASCRDEQ